MDTEADLLELLRDYRSGGEITEERALAALQKLAELQKIEESFVIASSVDIPEIDPVGVAELPIRTSPNSMGESRLGSQVVDEQADPVDLAIVVPLKEEFSVLYEEIREGCQVVQKNGSHYYRFVKRQKDGSVFNCVATFAGDMGNNKAGLVTQKLVANWDPSSLAIIGIAGGLGDDVRVGDVVAATLVDSYMENSKAIGGKDRFEVSLSGEPYRPSAQILNEIRNFEFAHAGEHSRWTSECSAIAEGLLGEAFKSLAQSDLVRPAPVLVEGHIASGPTVGGTVEFGKWLRDSRDRKYVALEMEGAGVLAAIYDSATNCQGFMLRGISDFADERKSQLDQLGGGLLRKYAVRASTQFLWQMISAGVLCKKSK